MQKEMVAEKINEALMALTEAGDKETAQIRRDWENYILFLRYDKAYQFTSVQKSNLLKEIQESKIILEKSNELSPKLNHILMELTVILS